VRTLLDLRRWAADAVPGTMIPAASLVELLDGMEDPEPELIQVEDPEPRTWRARLWEVPTETRLGVDDVAEAVGRSSHWVYRATSRDEDPLPSRKLSGRVVVTAGELRAWIRDQEVVVHGGPYLSVEAGGGR
jgi:hypothetical protein